MFSHAESLILFHLRRMDLGVYQDALDYSKDEEQEEEEKEEEELAFTRTRYGKYRKRCRNRRTSFCRRAGRFFLYA